MACSYVQNPCSVFVRYSTFQPPLGTLVSSCLERFDILIGAVAYRLNRHYDRPSANADKTRLCDFVLKRTGFDKYINVEKGSFRQKRFGTSQLWYRNPK
jgi:hypothetical protein